MKRIVIIPARYSSTRFPGKPLALILNKPMIQWVYDASRLAENIDDVYVATDDKRIFDVVLSFGGKALMTSDKHTCGTDRLAECVDILDLDDNDIVLNVQGDEPLANSVLIQDLLNCFEDKEVYMGTLKKKINSEEELKNPNVVKVICDAFDYAIYFSRFSIPFERNKYTGSYYKHVGAYGYKTWFLKRMSKMGKTKLELAESLEQLRVIENGYKIKVNETLVETIGVDSPENIQQVEEKIRSIK